MMRPEPNELGRTNPSSRGVPQPSTSCKYITRKWWSPLLFSYGDLREAMKPAKAVMQIFLIEDSQGGTKESKTLI